MKKKVSISLLVGLAVVAINLVSPLSALAAGPATINLGSAANFVILAKSGISTTGTTKITGDIGVSPIAASGMTGFGLIKDSTNTFATSSLVTGKAYAADYAAPTPATMTTAISDMETAFTTAAGRTNPTSTELGAGNIGGKTLTPGLYTWSTDVTIPTNVTLSGGASDIWIFQIAQKLTMSSAARVVLSGGAREENIFWQVAGQTTLGTTSVMNGNILDQTAIVMNTGAVLNGRALAQTAVTLDANTITAPTAVAVSTPTTNTNTATTTTNTNTTTTNTNTTTTNTATTNANTSTTANTNTVVGGTASADTNTSTPQLPNTGLAPKPTSSFPWFIIGAVLSSSICLALIIKKKMVTLR